MRVNYLPVSSTCVAKIAVHLFSHFFMSQSQCDTAHCLVIVHSQEGLFEGWRVTKKIVYVINKILHVIDFLLSSLVSDTALST